MNSSRRKAPAWPRCGRSREASQACRKRTAQPFDEMVLPAEDVDAGVERRQPFVDKRPAQPDDGLEAASSELS